MRILHILDHSIPLHSGYTFRTRAILEHQRALGFETFHITSAKHKGPDVLVEEVDGFRFYRTAQPKSFFSTLPVLNQFSIINSLAERVGEAVEEVKPDIIHAHSPVLNGLAALRVAQWFSLPVVYECRAFWEDAAVDHRTCREGGLRYRVTRSLETYVFRRASAVTTICEGLKRDIVERGIPEQNVTVIPNAVDINRFSLSGPADAELKKQLGLEENLVLGFIGSFYAYEGLMLLLEALLRILEVNPEVRLLLVGGGPQENLLKQRAQELGLSQKVIFSGRVPHDQVQKYYDQVDLFVYPRMSMRLTELVTPLKPLEALAHGKLVIASDVGGHRELIRHGETGWLFKAGDPGALADMVVSALNRRDEWSRFRVAGREYVERERTWAHSVSRYKPIYESLLNRSN
ncbi:TIGR04063 family PEP-CTERM/XrtA system glycosyltransferase [Methylocaldum sp.]|uniref:TIGR04063 family PEP-CTERM/XrtA system glycosyltransferase n=1 Tax=Methylocaldum sp. TaxID=1969727 RepID=UPI00321FADB2